MVIIMLWAVQPPTGDQPHPEPQPHPDGLCLIASDLDGTLLGTDHRVSLRTVAALETAAELAVPVVAITGRSQWSALRVLHGVPHIRWLIASNGAVLFDRQEATVIERHYPDPDVMAHAIEIVSQGLGEVGLAWETAKGVFHQPEFRDIRRRRIPDSARTEQAIGNLETEDETIIKLLVVDPELNGLDLLEKVHATMAASSIGRACASCLSITTSGAGFVELTALEAEKGLALNRLCRRLGLEMANAVAFGDHSNDIGMLAAVGRGYAMANAHPIVHAATTLRAPAHGEDGVAQVIEELLLR